MVLCAASLRGAPLVLFGLVGTALAIGRVFAPHVRSALHWAGSAPVRDALPHLHGRRYNLGQYSGTRHVGGKHAKTSRDHDG